MSTASATATTAATATALADAAADTAVVIGLALLIWAVLGIVYWLTVGFRAGEDTPMPDARKAANVFFARVRPAAMSVFRFWLKET